MFANPRGLTISTVTYLEFQKPFRSKTLMSCVFRKWLWICFVNFSVKKPHFFKGHGIVSDGLAYTRLHDTAGCQTGCTTGLTTVLNEQPPFVQPVVKRVWQPVECLYTRYDWLSNRFDNRFDNMLYRVSGTLVVTALVYQSTKCITLCSANFSPVSIYWVEWPRRGHTVLVCNQPLRPTQTSYPLRDEKWVPAKWQRVGR